jgi:hypothetical protein
MIIVCSLRLRALEAKRKAAPEWSGLLVNIKKR